MDVEYPVSSMREGTPPLSVVEQAEEEARLPVILQESTDALPAADGLRKRRDRDVDLEIVVALHLFGVSPSHPAL
jgi:hypothetical protein